MPEWTADLINLSEVIGSFAANMVQWLILGILFFVAQSTGNRVDALQNKNRRLEDAFSALFSSATGLPESARHESKALISNVANKVNNIRVRNFLPEHQRELMDEAILFGERYKNQLLKIELADSRYREFVEALQVFLAHVAAPDTKAAGSTLKLEFKNLKKVWHRFFDVVFSPLPLDEVEFKNLESLGIGFELGDAQLFFYRIFGGRQN